MLIQVAALVRRCAPARSSRPESALVCWSDPTGDLNTDPGRWNTLWPPPLEGLDDGRGAVVLVLLLLLLLLLVAAAFDCEPLRLVPVLLLLLPLLLALAFLGVVVFGCCCCWWRRTGGRGGAGDGEGDDKGDSGSSPALEDRSEPVSLSLCVRRLCLCLRLCRSCCCWQNAWNSRGNAPGWSTTPPRRSHLVLSTMYLVSVACSLRAASTRAR